MEFTEQLTRLNENLDRYDRTQVGILLSAVAAHYLGRVPTTSAFIVNSDATDPDLYIMITIRPSVAAVLNGLKDMMND